MIVSISGPSGSGKGMMFNKVANELSYLPDVIPYDSDPAQEVFDSMYDMKYSSIDSLNSSRSHDTIDYQIELSRRLLSTTKQYIDDPDHLLLLNGGLLTSLVYTNLSYHSLQSSKDRKKYKKLYSKIINKLLIVYQNSHTIMLTDNCTSLQDSHGQLTGSVAILTNRSKEMKLYTEYKFDAGCLLLLSANNDNSVDEAKKFITDTLSGGNDIR